MPELLRVWLLLSNSPRRAEQLVQWEMLPVCLGGLVINEFPDY